MKFEWSKEQKAVLATQGNTLVSASAGSGKTTVLIEKIMRLLKEGKELDRILVMTFSRASAQDMKNKLVEKIYKELTPDEQGKRLQKQLDKIPFSNISTINSFCYSLLKKYFSEAGADPSATMLDEREKETMLDECLDTVIAHELERQENEEFFKVLTYLSKKRNTGDFKEAVLLLREFLSVQENPDAFLERAAEDREEILKNFYLKRTARQLRDGQNALQQLIDDSKEEGCSVNDEAYADIRMRLGNAVAANRLEECFAELGGIVFPRKYNVNLVKKGTISQRLADDSGKVHEQLKKMLEDIGGVAELYERSKQSADKAQSQTVIRVLIRAYRETEKEYRARKKQRCCVDFNDAERAALSILSDEKIREEIKGGFDYVFIDEYQDTNYLQEALLAGVSNGNNLFAVGDVKQAIYGFRLAEPRIFNERRKKYDADRSGENKQLNDNYRSCGGVLTFTNEVCAEIMTENFCEVDYRGTAMLVSGTGGESRSEDVRIYTYPKIKREKTKAKPGTVYRVKTGEKETEDGREGEFIARTVLRMHAEGRKYGDFAVLLRKSNKIESVVKALSDKKIPYYIARDSKSDLPEREVLVDAMRLLVNEDEDVALVNVLTKMFRFSSEELLKIRIECGKRSLWESLIDYKEDQTIKNKIDTFIGKIAEWRFASGYMTVADLMRECLRSGYDAELLSSEEKVGAVRAFVLFVEKQAAGMSIGEFLRYYDKVYNGNKPCANPDSVTVMTLHGSKGLEFPVVFMPYTSQAFGGGKNGGNIRCDRDLGLAVCEYDEENHEKQNTFEAKMLALKAADEELEGEARLMYVAFTRAKEKLLIIGEEKTFDGSVFSAKCIMDWLLYTQRKNASFKRYFETMPEAEETCPVCPPAHPKSFDFSRLEKKYAYTEATVSPAKTSVTALLSEDDRGAYVSEKDDRRQIRGNAFHAVLKYIDFSADTEEKVALETVRMKNEGLISEEYFEACDVKKIAAALSSPLMKRIAEYKVSRERPFISYLYPKEGATDRVLVQGIIDLMAEKPDGTILLLDYKTSLSEKGALAERYGEQLRLYTAAVEGVLKKKVSERILFNVERGYTVEI